MINSLLTIKVLDEDYFRNVTCSLNSISICSSLFCSSLFFNFFYKYIVLKFAGVLNLFLMSLLLEFEHLKNYHIELTSFALMLMLKSMFCGSPQQAYLLCTYLFKGTSIIFHSGINQVCVARSIVVCVVFFLPL